MAALRGAGVPDSSLAAQVAAKEGVARARLAEAEARAAELQVALTQLREQAREQSEQLGA